ncbi:hypothetical protein ACWDUM_15880 [Rhodococcus sp. NPDC003322]
MRFRDGRDVRWSVRRRWLPWRRRTSVPDWGPGFDSISLGDDPISAVIGIVLLVLMLPVLVLALVVGLEFLLLLLLLPVWVVVRVLFGVPWIVVVRRDGKVVHEEAVRGWRESRARIEAIAAQLRDGRDLAAIRSNR